MQVVILAGGRGTRLKTVTGDLPKPLVDLCGEPLLGRQLELIAATQACRDVLILTGYGAEQIDRFCGNGERWNLRVRCIAEQEARGTAGAVLDACELLEPTFIVMYGDTVLDVDLDRLIAHHQAARSAATLFLHPNDHPADSDLVDLDRAGFVRSFRPYPHPEGADYANIVNAGLYVLERSALADLNGLPEKPDFGKHVFSRMLERGQRILGYLSPEYIKDAGTPERIEKVRKDFGSGRVSRLSLRHPVPAVFLDRDGVLNEERNRISRGDDLVLVPGAAAAVARLNRSDYRTVVVTNQPVVARGDCTEDELARIHARLDSLLGAGHAFVDRLYYCPHHPDGGFPGEVAELKRVCECRKPAPGMIHQAATDLNLDLPRSWMIGDATSDIELARRVGLRSVLVRTGHGGRDARHIVRPDFVVGDLAEAAQLVLDHWEALAEKASEVASGIRAGDVILIAGAARSGKSTFASALSIVLRDANLSAQVISLDNWLRSEADREQGVLGRYDMKRAEEAIALLLSRNHAVLAPSYNEMTRVSVPDQFRLYADPQDVVIVEGCTALASDALRQLATRRLYVSNDESERHRRFVAEYERRGMSAAEIASLYSSRNEDELPLIEASSAHADQRILFK